MPVVTNFAFSLVLGDMPVISISIAIVIVVISVLRSCHDLILEIRARLHGGGDIGRGMFLIHAHQNGGNSIKKLISVRLLHGLGAAGSDGLIYFFRRGGQQPTSHSHEQARGEGDEHDGEPVTGGFGFHIWPDYRTRRLSGKINSTCGEVFFGSEQELFVTTA